jgi:paraquat-inducible protein B
MEEDVKYFKLGLFFLTSIGLMVIGIVFLGVMDYFRPSFTIETYFSAQSVRGLEIGAPVKILGVTTGKVTEISTAGLVYRKDQIIEALKAGEIQRLADEEFQRSIMVRMEIVPQQGLGDLGDLRSELLQAMVDLGIRARLSQSGLAGPVFIDLEYVDPEIYPVPDLPWEPNYFYVPSAPGIVSELTATATSILNRLRKTDLTETLDKLDRGFEIISEFIEEIDVTETRDEMVILAEDVRQLTERLHEFLNDPRLDQALADFAETTYNTLAILKDRGEDLGSTLETIPRTAIRLERVAARTEELLEDERLGQILEGMSQAAGSAGKTMENTEATTAELRRLVRELNRLTMILNDDLNVITENLRRVTEDAEVITGEMRDNLSRLILGKEPPHFNPGEPDKPEKKK